MDASRGAYAKHWCFTLNNPSGLRPEGVLPYDYLVYGNEESEPPLCTPHLQGYVVLKTKKRLSSCKQYIDRAHWEVAKGTPLQNRAYCTKEGDYMEFGTMPRSSGEAGKACEEERWRRVHDLAKQGNVEAFVEENPQISFMYPDKFKSLVAYYRPPVQQISVMEHYWYLGPAGSGKSKKAREIASDKLYLKPTCTKWWPNYNGEPFVLIDDLSKTHEFVLVWLKNWADHYPFQAETKGGHTGLIRPKTFIITSQYHWDELTLDTELRAAIARRFTIRRFGETAPVNNEPNLEAQFREVEPDDIFMQLIDE